MIDRVQELAQAHTDDALARHASRPRSAGRTTCAFTDCGQPIHPVRTANGAVLCIDCQREEEARNAQFSGRRRGG